MWRTEYVLLYRLIVNSTGGQAICRALLKNTTLEEINLASNELSEPTASLLQQVVMQNRSLTRLELSCNRFGPVSRVYED